eukprot:m.453130 g.453130  ORF g.453130 m.453130 type:complete len:75 (+) comp20441_c0_seq1:82-306(+)
MDTILQNNSHSGWNPGTPLLIQTNEDRENPLLFGIGNGDVGDPNASRTPFEKMIVRLGAPPTTRYVTPSLGSSA